jgi:hypothetical protein
MTPSDCLDCISRFSTEISFLEQDYKILFQMNLQCPFGVIIPVIAFIAILASISASKRGCSDFWRFFDG